MTISEFWRSVEAIYGSCYGRSLVGDLYLPELGSTASQALRRGVEPIRIWDALVNETDMGEEARWVHRGAQAKNK
ncbi:MAG: DUF3046 domain-containing protein [Actinomycetaceae bacterium]|nr:DUF3046 domain-containing protein [Actinomycetaceae bacterium]